QHTGRSSPMLISEVARRSGVPPKTLRYYEGIGLLRPERTPAGYREYDDHIFDRLTFIRSAQALGLSLAEIRSIVCVRDNGEAPCAHVTGLLQERSAAIARTIRELRTLQSELRVLIARAENFNPSDCDQDGICGLINPG
ncbi:MAG: heavy metal-responsive transcriptional regulator, partial [Actinobacteria bacterium]|nr:heavy metal-responsive transcriptional regulator [Actinomycetota bacterium]